MAKTQAKLAKVAIQDADAMNGKESADSLGDEGDDGFFLMARLHWYKVTSSSSTSSTSSGQWMTVEVNSGSQVKSSIKTKSYSSNNNKTKRKDLVSYDEKKNTVSDSKTKKLRSNKEKNTKKSEKIASVSVSSKSASKKATGAGIRTRGYSGNGHGNDSYDSDGSHSSYSSSSSGESGSSGSSSSGSNSTSSSYSSYSSCSSSSSGSSASASSSSSSSYSSRSSCATGNGNSIEEEEIRVKKVRKELQTEVVGLLQRHCWEEKSSSLSTVLLNKISKNMDATSIPVEINFISSKIKAKINKDKVNDKNNDKNNKGTNTNGKKILSNSFSASASADTNDNDNGSTCINVCYNVSSEHQPAVLELQLYVSTKKLAVQVAEEENINVNVYEHHKTATFSEEKTRELMHKSLLALTRDGSIMLLSRNVMQCISLLTSQYSHAMTSENLDRSLQLARVNAQVLARCLGELCSEGRTGSGSLSGSLSLTPDYPDYKILVDHPSDTGKKKV